MKNKIIIVILLISKFSIAQIHSDIYSSVVGPNNEPVIFNAINMNSYDLISSNIQFSEDNSLQKLVISPFKLIDDYSNSLVRNTKLNISQKNGISTFGLGLGIDNSSPFSKRGNKIFDAMKFPKKRVKEDKESEQEYKEYEARFYFTIDSLQTAFHRKLLINSFQVTLAMNTSFFSVIGGDKIDKDNDGLIDNQNSVESYNYSLSLAYAFNETIAFNISLHNIRQLSEPTEGQERVDYLGASFSIAKRIKILDKNYQYSDDYRKSLFIPSIFMGVAIEFLEAQDNFEFAKDSITKKVVYTPFLDFRINLKNQFRIGIPIQKFESETDEIKLGPYIQWGFSLSNLN